MPSSHSPLPTIDAALDSRGWHRDNALPGSLAIGGNALAAGTVRLARHTRDDTTLLIADATDLPRAPDEAPSYDALFERFLDLTRLERLVLWTAARRAGAHFALCIGPQGTRLVDAATELPVATCNPANPDSLDACLDALDAPRAALIPERSALSEDLARWFQLLAGALGPAMTWSRHETQRLGYQLILGLKILAETPDPPLELIGLRVEAQPDAIAVDWTPPPASEWVEPLLAAAHHLVPDGADALPAFERRALARQIANAPGSAQRALSGVFQLAAAKRRPDVMLGLLTSPNHEHAAWRLALTDPLDVANQTTIADFYVFEPLELDLEEVGFGRVLEAVEKLALLALDQNAALHRAGGRQLDLIEPPPEGLSPDAGTLDDPFNWLFRHALRLRVALPYRHALGYLLALHIADLRTRLPFSNYPPTPLTALPAAIQLGSTDA